MRLKNISNKVVNNKQTVFLNKIKFLNKIIIINLLFFLNYNVIFVETNIVLIMRDKEDKNLLIKTIHLFFISFFCRYLFIFNLILITILIITLQLYTFY